MHVIYGIKNKKNNKLYIGSAVDCQSRWNRHRSDLNLNQHHNIHLQRAWNKYGEESFEFVILELVVQKEQLILREQHYIDLYKFQNPEAVYNICLIAGSSLGVKHTQESKQIFRQAQIKRYEDTAARTETGEKTRLGWQKPGIKAAASQRMKKYWANPANRVAQRKRMKIITNNPEIAKKRSEGLRRRFSDPKECRRLSLSSPNRKRIQHIESGVIYESISDAVKVLPISIQTIKNNLLGKFKSRKGYNFIEVKKDG